MKPGWCVWYSRFGLGYYQQCPFVDFASQLQGSLVPNSAQSRPISVAFLMVPSALLRSFSDSLNSSCANAIITWTRHSYFQVEAAFSTLNPGGVSSLSLTSLNLYLVLQVFAWVLSGHILTIFVQIEMMPPGCMLHGSNHSFHLVYFLPFFSLKIWPNNVLISKVVVPM